MDTVFHRSVVLELRPVNDLQVSKWLMVLGRCDVNDASAGGWLVGWLVRGGVGGGGVH